MNSNPFIRPQANQAPSRTPAPQRPGGEWGAGLAEALSEANGPARRRAAARRDDMEHAKCQAWIRERLTGLPATSAAWSQVGDGSCPVLGPVARWLRVPVPMAARDRAEFVDRLDVLVRLADDLATRAQALADGEGWEDWADPPASVVDATAAIADECLRIACEVRRFAWSAAPMDRADMLHGAAGIVESVVCSLTWLERSFACAGRADEGRERLADRCNGYLNA